MMKDKKEIAKLIYDGLKKGDIRLTLSLISKELEEEKTGKLKFTKTPLLNSIGQELGKLLLNEDWKFERLLKLWKKGKRDERLIVISALEKISKKDYENSKQFVFEILDDISDWEICDQLALRVIVNLAVQNQKETFSLMERWINSENKWLRRLAVATIPPYIRVRKTESKICLEFLDKIMREKDRDVKKAISWALREVTKKDPKSVFEFLQKWAKVDDKNTKWIIKEGMKKLSEKEQKELKSLVNKSTKSTNRANEDLIAYCGLYCGDCFFYKGEIADLARDLRKKLREAKLHKTYKEFSKFAKEFKDYPVCYDVLGAMVKMRCKGCRKGRGPLFCKIRKCCQKKGIEGCWECDEFETCKKLDFLKPNHGDVHIKNLRKIKKYGIEAFLEGKRYW